MKAKRLQHADGRLTKHGKEVLLSINTRHYKRRIRGKTNPHWFGAEEIGPQLTVCPHCCSPISANDASYQAGAGKPTYHLQCAVLLCMVKMIETKPAKWGGHTYQGPVK
jgi:hypothetical protein